MVEKVRDEGYENAGDVRFLWAKTQQIFHCTDASDLRWGYLVNLDCQRTTISKAG